MSVPLHCGPALWTCAADLVPLLYNEAAGCCLEIIILPDDFAYFLTT